jgi:hypothetical protein
MEVTISNGKPSVFLACPCSILVSHRRPRKLDIFYRYIIFRNYPYCFHFVGLAVCLHLHMRSSTDSAYEQIVSPPYRGGARTTAGVNFNGITVSGYLQSSSLNLAAFISNGNTIKAKPQVRTRD